MLKLFTIALSTTALLMLPAAASARDRSHSGHGWSGKSKWHKQHRGYGHRFGGYGYGAPYYYRHGGYYGGIGYYPPYGHGYGYGYGYPGYGHGYGYGYPGYGYGYPAYPYPAYGYVGQG